MQQPQPRGPLPDDLLQWPQYVQWTLAATTELLPKTTRLITEYYTGPLQQINPYEEQTARCAIVSFKACDYPKAYAELKRRFPGPGQVECVWSSDGLMYVQSAYYHLTRTMLRSCLGAYEEPYIYLYDSFEQRPGQSRRWQPQPGDQLWPYLGQPCVYHLTIGNQFHYVGYSRHISNRILSHLIGTGSQWTRHCRGEQQCLPVTGLTVQFGTVADENRLSQELREKYGRANVRGGRWSSIADGSTEEDEPVVRYLKPRPTGPSKPAPMDLTDDDKQPACVVVDADVVLDDVVQAVNEQPRASPQAQSKPQQQPPTMEDPWRRVEEAVMAMEQHAQSLKQQPSQK